MGRPPGRHPRLLTTVMLLFAVMSGCSMESRAYEPVYHGGLSILGALAAALGGASSTFFEFVESGAYHVVNSGADFEEWRMRYGR
ncbi:MAG: hypothetical protein IT436_04960 [Phycisphaerales bacterium]|nr:hypothetical protein [Phycisphaerales bacterium]